MRSDSQKNNPDGSEEDQADHKGPADGTFDRDLKGRIRIVRIAVRIVGDSPEIGQHRKKRKQIDRENGHCGIEGYFVQVGGASNRCTVEPREKSRKKAVGNDHRYLRKDRTKDVVGRMTYVSEKKSERQKQKEFLGILHEKSKKKRRMQRQQQKKQKQSERQPKKNSQKKMRSR